MFFLAPPSLFRLPQSPTLQYHYSPTCTTEQPQQKQQQTPQSPPQRDQLYSLVTSTNSRTQPDSKLNPLITTLESLSQTNTASNPDLIGTWTNVYTTTPSTSSIIQRTIVSSVFVPRAEQVIHSDTTNTPSKIINRVDLRAPLGCILNVRALVENINTCRLSIRFDRAWFEFDRLPVWLGAAHFPTLIRVPYPVPFRLLGDKARGWLDVTYLDSVMRISRGNRGSCFVLVKEQAQPLPLSNYDLD